MGAYLSTPATKKKSDDFTDCEKYECGVSGMQGWRINMEDAHNCIPDVGDDTGFFAVYDGHGGGEVAIYCSLHFTEIMKLTDEYNSGKLEDSLKKTFMEIDKKLKEPPVVKELKLLSEMEPGDAPPTEEDFKKMEEQEKEDAENAEDETRLLYEEATMNIEDLLAKYGRAVNETKQVMKSFMHDSDLAQSGSCKEKILESTDNFESVDQPAQVVTSKENTDNILPPSDTSTTEEVIDKSNEASNESKKEDSVDKVEEKKEAKKVLKKTFIKTKVNKIDDEDSEDEDDDYDGFESDEAIEGSSSEEEEEEEEEDTDDDIEDECEVVEESEEQENMSDNVVPGMGSGIEEPGADSGTTAVVALLRGLDLHVANAGDSRCVLSRCDGKAFDMSDDHKPEDEAELTRIKAAGGHVNMQGRVNGGLNLSRAIGDHCYKTNKDLPLEKQMISAMPDLRSVRLEPGDEFMVLACDGIWNVFSSQEVVDFIRHRLFSKETEEEKEISPEEKKLKLSQICEELFDKCLAPDTMGDGTGCDNMTCMIVRFNQDWLSRQSNANAPTSDSKNIESTLMDNNSLENLSENVGVINESGDVIKVDDDATKRDCDVKSSNIQNDQSSDVDCPKENNKRPRNNEMSNCINGNGFEAKKIKTD